METKILPALDFILQEDGQKKINQAKLIKFLEASGYHYVPIEKKLELVKIANNLARKSSIHDIVQFIRIILEEADSELWGEFLRSPGSYVGAQKLLALQRKEIFDDRDLKSSSKFFFQNCFCEVTSTGISVNDYESLAGTIWDSRIVKRSYEKPPDNSPGQFEQFCHKITGGNEQRLLALQSWYGYLLHRNRARGEDKLIILYDEKMGEGNAANGRTGKSLLGKALSQVREVVPFDGKDFKQNSVFKNQRLDHTSDLLIYDDYTKGQNVEHLYSILTFGIEVEKKGKPSFYINVSEAPKILITSNYYVPGDGGDSDKDRRYEFEIINYYSKNRKPEHEFGYRFFTESWPKEEWNKFFSFLFNCVQVYLTHGLIEAEPINLYKSKLISSTCEEFEEFAEAYFEIGVEMDKRELEEMIKQFYPKLKNISPHQFYKWCKIYAHQRGLEFKAEPSGGNYPCVFYYKEVTDEKA